MILMINGSMRGSTGNTGSFLRTLEPKLKGEVQTVELRKYTADLAPCGGGDPGIAPVRGWISLQCDTAAGGAP